MELTLEQACLGKATQIKGKEFFNTEKYIMPFIDRMSKYTDDFIINAIPANQISLTPTGEANTEDIVYNRMWVQAVMPDEAGYDNHDRVCGMVYGLDVRKPVVKFYVGGLNQACCNLCIFSPSFLNIQELESEKAIDYNPIKKLLEQTDNVKATLEKFAKTEVPYDQRLINENLGRWIRNTMEMQYNNSYGKVKVSASTAIDAFKLVYEDADSPYFVNEGCDTNLFNIYNAFTQCVTDSKDIFNRAEKTLLINDIITL